jgi:hypothetical protein
VRVSGNSGNDARAGPCNSFEPAGENKQRPQNYEDHDRDDHHDIDQEIGQSADGKTNSVRNQTSRQDSLSQ